MKIILFLISIFVITACKKNKPHELTGNKAIFVGTWHWVYSTHRHNYCDGGDVVTDTLTPETEGHNFKIIFDEKGNLIYLQDEVKLQDYSIYFTQFNDTGVCLFSSGTKFGIAYTYEGTSELFGCVSHDSLWTKPFKEFLFPFTPGCEEYNNFFVKE